MLILSKTVAENILRGRQSMIIKDCPNRCWNVGARHKVFNGHPHNGAKSTMDVIILSTAQISLGEIDHAQASQLGFESQDMFIDVWKKSHRDMYNPEAKVWLVELEAK